MLTQQADPTALVTGFLEPSWQLFPETSVSASQPVLSPDLSPLLRDGCVSCCHQAKLAVPLGSHCHFIPSPSCIYLSSSTKGVPINFH